jgi:phospholipid/cholesterol/gamma-HCH transport system substrate-binding protein
MQSAWKVGALVLVFVGLLAGALVVLNASIFSKPTDHYYVRFADAGGLDSGAEVLLAGVSIGKVEKVQLSDQGDALVTLSIEKGRTISKKFIAVLPTSFISIGDHQVLLQAATNETGNYEPNNLDTPIPGKLQGPLEGILPDTSSTITELNKTMVAFRELLEDKELRNGLVNIMKSGEQTSTKFGKLADNLNGTLARNSGEIDTLMASMVTTMKSVQVVSKEIETFASSGKLQNQTDTLLTTMNQAASEGKALMEDLRAYTADPEMQESLKKTIDNFEKMSDSGVNIASDAEQMSKNGIEITAQTRDLMTKANNVADEVSKLIEDVKGAVQKFDPTNGSGSLLPKVEVESGLTYTTDNTHLRSDVNLIIPSGKDKLIFGLYDAFETNKINLMLEKGINDRTDLRYGVYASKPGVGVSYRFAPSTWLQSELFGLNDPQLDIRLKHRFNETIHGWVGVDKVFGRNTPAIGIGIKR